METGSQANESSGDYYSKAMNYLYSLDAHRLASYEHTVPDISQEELHQSFGGEEAYNSFMKEHMEEFMEIGDIKELYTHMTVALMDAGILTDRDFQELANGSFQSKASKILKAMRAEIYAGIV